MNKQEENLSVAAREYTRDSILRGVPLSHFKVIAGSFRRSEILFQELVGGAQIAYRIYNGLDETKKQIEAIVDEEKKAAEKDDSIMIFEDYQPLTWQSGDPKLNKRIDRFIRLLDQAVSRASDLVKSDSSI